MNKKFIQNFRIRSPKSKIEREPGGGRVWWGTPGIERRRGPEPEPKIKRKPKPKYGKKQLAEKEPWDKSLIHVKAGKLRVETDKIKGINDILIQVQKNIKWAAEVLKEEQQDFLELSEIKLEMIRIELHRMAHSRSGWNLNWFDIPEELQEEFSEFPDPKK